MDCNGNNVDTLVDTIIKSDTIFSRDIKSTIMVDENRKIYNNTKHENPGDPIYHGIEYMATTLNAHIVCYIDYSREGEPFITSFRSFYSWEDFKKYINEELDDMKEGYIEFWELYHFDKNTIMRVMDEFPSIPKIPESVMDMY